MVIMLFASFLIFIFLGMPIAFSLGVSSIVYLLFNDIPLIIAAQKMYSGIDSFVLICIPGFILAGNLMNSGGITKRIIRFSNGIVGWITGGLGIANVAASMLFAGISGTALADTASLGAILIPGMKEEGYDADFSAAITASSSTIGPIIPPSLPMIIVGTLSGLSVSKLFVAGAVPGVLLSVGLMAVGYFIAKKRKYPKGKMLPFKELISSFYQAFWALLMTFIILFGILGGFFTPTEASIVAVLYALIVGIFIYKELKIREIPGLLLESMLTTASIMVLVGLAKLFAWILASEQIPQMVASGILSLSDNPIVIILLINVLLLFVGSFMETIAALVILFPVLLPVSASIGMDPIHFGVMVVLNLMIGLTTPPVGVCLFVASSIAELPILKTAKAILPFLAISLIVLLMVAFIPQITLFLPGLLK